MMQNSNKTLEELLNDQGKYVATNGATFGDVETFILEGLMGFCGCGKPWAANKVLYKSLLHIESLCQFRDRNSGIPGSDSQWTKDFDSWNKAGVELFGNEGIEMLIYYMLNKAEMIEHGGSVPGWLSPLGESCLKHLKEINPEPPTSAPDPLPAHSDQERPSDHPIS